MTDDFDIHVLPFMVILLKIFYQQNNSVLLCSDGFF